MTEPDDALTNLIKTMTKLAKEDQVITEEEEELLTNAQINMMTYDNMIVEFLEDGVIDEEESDILQNFKEMIVQEAVELSNLSTDPNSKEMKTLSNLIEYLRK
ncbi:MAG: hypothetical protein KAR35_01295 [Candidatus Heimdallarchaeota archaeon]|nr:hypothetical protein [Candidatus Heimdallarchaeota archaeon]MCK5047990.1 hypothetical protein [Candidatus Heimdallarchaeota archaeon]